MKPVPRPPEIRFRKSTLVNGLDVITRRQGVSPIVAVNLWYHVGSQNEERGRRGFAHLFEHLMFEGSEHYAGDFFKPLQRLGANVNGSTSADRTNYIVDIPTAHLEQVLAMESDRMGWFLPALTEEKLRIQKDVVKNEYRQNYENRPYGLVWRILAEALYPANHPYSWTTIGIMEDVEAATKDEVAAFFRRFYVPANASLAIIGDVDEDRAFELAERYFAEIPGGASSLRPSTPEVRLDRPIDLALRDRVELERIYLNWHAVPRFHRDEAALSLLSDILTRGRSSRLYRLLVIDRQVAQDVTSSCSARELAGTFGVVVTLRPGIEPAVAREAVERALIEIAEQGVDEAELERVRNGRVAGFIYALDEIGGFGGVADRLNAYNIYLGDPERVTSDLQRYLDVDREQIRLAAGTYCDPGRRLCLTVMKQKPKTVAPPLDRRRPPASAPSRTFQAPVPEIRALSNGIPLWILPRRDLPMVVGTFVIERGASSHPPSLGGLASITTAMLDEGAGRLSAAEIADRVERLGSRLWASAGWDGSYVGFQCLSNFLDDTLDVAVDVLRAPTFPESEWTRIHAQTLASLKADADKAESRAARAFLNAVFPESHPHRIPLDGDEAAVASLSLDDLKAFHDNHFAPNACAIVAAGDVDPDDLAGRIEARLRAWSKRGRERPEPGRLDHKPGPRVILLDRPGASQAVIRVGHIGTHRLDPNYSDLLVLNQILGGQFTSRLNAKLREEKGFTYGVRSQFDCRRAPGPFVISASIQGDKLGEALGDIFAEVEALLDHKPPTAAEIDDARRSLIEGQARLFESPSDLVSRYASLLIHNLPSDHHLGFSERLAAVTRDSLIEAARESIRPAELTVVVAADASKSLPDLLRLGRLEVERYDEHDEPLRPNA